ncbi:MAG: amidohydrolase [Clostridium sp.]
MLFKDLSIQTREFSNTSPEDNKIVIFIAKKIITMADNIAEAEAVAVRNREILAVGSLSQITSVLNAKGLQYEINDSFKDNVILPGFIEAHMHCQYTGANLNHIYAGYFDRHSPEGELIKGCTNIDQIITRLKETLESNKDKYNDNTWLCAYGVDTLVLGDVVIDRNLLDTISKEVPVAVVHQSGHVMSINTRAIELSGSEERRNSHIGRYEDGTCNGIIAELPNLGPILAAGALKVNGEAIDIACKAGIDAGKVAKVNGCTTITDKGFGIPIVKDPIDGYKKMIETNEMPCRLVVEPIVEVVEPVFKGWDGLENLRKEMENDKFIFGNGKVVPDGSIQQYTAHLLNDKYYDGTPNSEMVMSKEQIKHAIKLAEDHGYACSVHANGNGATELIIQAIEELHSEEPNTLFRHSLEHNQLVTENQLYRMKQQGISCNFFSNHMFYYGDIHAKFTVGPHEVKRMNPFRSAKNNGIRFTFHSDSPITEVAPLFSAWCACNRKSMTGVVYGEDQCLTVAEALRCITVEASWLLGLEDKVGTIEPGKWADFVVLEEEPTEEKKETLKDIKVITTVLGGKVL